MPRSRPPARPARRARSVRLLTRYPFTVDDAVATACAVADGQPALVVFVLDGDGLLIAVRAFDLAPNDVEETCATLLGLLAPEGRGPAVLVSVDPGFGADPAPVVPTWHEVRRVFEQSGSRLLDWLLVAGPQVVSVAHAVEGAGR